MKGFFLYMGEDGQIHDVEDSDDIPNSALELVCFRTPPPPPPPHTQSDHDAIEATRREFDVVYERIYGRPPPSKESIDAYD